MKKFFKSLALASVALSGMLFSACQLENIQTTFKPTAAVATIEVTVLDGVTGQDITKQSVITASSTANTVIKIDGNKAIITGNYEIPAQVVTVYASCNSKDATPVAVVINPLLAGGKASYTATLIVGSPIPPSPVTPAVATLIYKVTDLNTNQDVTSLATVTAVSSERGSLTPAGNVITLAGNNALESQVVTFNASYDGRTSSNQVSVAALNAGEEATYYVNLFLPKKDVPVDPAKAIVSVRVFDQQGNELTLSSEISAVSSAGLTPTKKDNVFTFAGTQAQKALPAQEVTVNATYDGKAATPATLKLDAVAAGAVMNYAVSLIVPNDVPEPVVDPAVAYITFDVFDLESGKSVLDQATISIESSLGAIYSHNQGLVTIKGTNDVAAQQITIKATLGTRTASSVVELAALEAPKQATYSTTVVLPAPEPVIIPAKAYINVKVVDDETGADVTASATVSAESTVDTPEVDNTKKVVTLSNVAGLAAQTVTVNAKVGAKTADAAVVELAEIATGSSASYYVTLHIPYEKPEPVVDPAKAYVSFDVIDLASGASVLAEATLTITSSTGETLSHEAGVITLTGDKDLAAQTVTIKAVYEGRTATQTVEVAALQAPAQKYYSTNVLIPAPLPIHTPAEAVITVKVIDEETGADVTASATVTASAEVDQTKVDDTTKAVYLLNDEGLVAQNVTVNASVNGKDAEPVIVRIGDIAIDTKVEYFATLTIKKEEPAPVVTPAKATIILTVIDEETGDDVTAYAAFTATSTIGTVTPVGNEIVITGNTLLPQIFSQTVTVNATVSTSAGDRIARPVKVHVLDQAPNTETRYYAVLSLMKLETPAKITLTASAYDQFSCSDVTADAEFSFEYLGVSGEQTDNVLVLTGALDIPATTVLVKAKYDNREASAEVALGALPMGVETSYTVQLNFKSECIYDYVYKNSVVTKEDKGFFNPTHSAGHSHSYSHATTGHGEGDGNWAYNETEFILNAVVKYDAEYGVIKSALRPDEATIAEDEREIAQAYADLIGTNTVVTVPVELPIQISAWAMYSVYAVKMYYTTTYSLMRYAPGQEPVEIAEIDQDGVFTFAEYCEAAVPGHGHGHYHYGHGHSDVHGYSDNAGGGIIWSE